MRIGTRNRSTFEQRNVEQHVILCLNGFAVRLSMWARDVHVCNQYVPVWNHCYVVHVDCITAVGGVRGKETPIHGVLAGSKGTCARDVANVTQQLNDK